MRLSNILDNALVWNLFRISLDLTWGAYRKRQAVMQEWGLRSGRQSVIDIGCGIGNHARITDGDYLGVDLNSRYIDYAARKHRERPNLRFRSIDATALLAEETRYDIALMVDFLHHISDENVVGVLRTASQLAGRVVNFEPVTDQSNPVGGWIVRNDRGQHMRSSESLVALYALARLEIVERRDLRIGPINTVAILAQPVLPTNN